MDMSTEKDYNIYNNCDTQYDDSEQIKENNDFEDDDNTHDDVETYNTEHDNSHWFDVINWRNPIDAEPDDCDIDHGANYSSRAKQLFCIGLIAGYFAFILYVPYVFEKYNH